MSPTDVGAMSYRSYREHKAVMDAQITAMREHAD
jgi:hypothetical protein